MVGMLSTIREDFTLYNMTRDGCQLLMIVRDKGGVSMGWMIFRV